MTEREKRRVCDREREKESVTEREEGGGVGGQKERGGGGENACSVRAVLREVASRFAATLAAWIRV